MSSPLQPTGEDSLWNGTALLAQSGNKRLIITPSARATLRAGDPRAGVGSDLAEETASIASGVSLISQGVLAGNVYRVGGLTRELVEKLQESEREGTLAALPPNIEYIELKPGAPPPKGFAWEKQSKKSKPRINLIPDSIRKIAGIRSVSEKCLSALDPSFSGEGDMESGPWDSRTKQMFLREVEIWKAPGDTLGFYVSRGDGHERTDGVFISRLMLGSYVERLGLLQVGDEILAINSIPVGDMPLQNVVMLLKYVQRLVLAVKAPSGWSHLYKKFNKRSKPSRKAPPIPIDPPNPPARAPPPKPSLRPGLIPFPSVAPPLQTRQRSSSSAEPHTNPIIPPNTLIPIHARGFSDISMPNPISYRPREPETDTASLTDHQHSLSSSEAFHFKGLVAREQFQQQPGYLLNAEQISYLAQLEREKHLFALEDTSMDTQHTFVDPADIVLDKLPVVLPLDDTIVTPVVEFCDPIHTDSEQELDSTPLLPHHEFHPQLFDTDQESVPSAPPTEIADSESMPDIDPVDTPSVASINLSREGSVVELPPLHEQLAEVPQDDMLLPKIYIK